MSFEKLGLASELLSALEKQGYKQPTSVQRLAIPKILMGRDMIAGAQTGTGKTAAFTLPILQKLVGQVQASGPKSIKALILTPTRELACQVHESVLAYAQDLPIKAEVLYGGVDFTNQVRKLEEGADLIVATPGRLMDHFDQGHLNFRSIRHLVIDEADRMLDMGFIPEVRRLMSKLPRQRQTLLFSATFTHEVQSLAQVLLKKPEVVQAAKTNSTADKVTHIVHPVDIQKKRPLLSYLIGSNNWQQVLIFTRTKVSADALSKELALDGIRNKVIHGDKTQGARTKALELFKAGEIQALVATDIAARGLDIRNLPHVINYELPNVPEDYVHRVGRTGRAGLGGHAVTLVTDKEVFRLRAIEQLIKMDLDKKKVPGFEPKNFDPEAIEADIKRRQRARNANLAEQRRRAQGKPSAKPGQKPVRRLKKKAEGGSRGKASGSGRGQLQDRRGKGAKKAGKKKMRTSGRR